MSGGTELDRWNIDTQGILPEWVNGSYDQDMDQMNTRIVHVDRVSSTQDVAREMVSQELGAVVVADVQEEGRGRRGHV